MMEIQELVHLAAEHLRADEFFADVPVVEEDVGNIAKELEAKMAKRRICAMVGWDGFTSGGNSSTVIFGEAQLVVSVFEQPVVNRRNEAAKTLLQVAKAVANALQLFTPEPSSSPLVFTSITRTVSLTGGDDGVITCDVKFKVESDL